MKIIKKLITDTIFLTFFYKISQYKENHSSSKFKINIIPEKNDCSKVAKYDAALKHSKLANSLFFLRKAHRHNFITNKKK
jgi:hypothetical protein